MKSRYRMLWIVAALAALAIALVGLQWMIQGAWLASFADRHGVMNPPMWVRAPIFFGGLIAAIWSARNAIRK